VTRFLSHSRAFVATSSLALFLVSTPRVAAWHGLSLVKPNVSALASGAAAGASASSSDIGGGQITYQTQTALMLMNADGSGRTKLPVQIGFPSWTADGTQLLQWNSDLSAAVLTNADGTHRQNVSMPGEQPVISPDGKAVAFEGTNGVGVNVEGIDGKNVRKITSVSPLLRDPGVAWSPNSQSIIFSGPRADPTKGCSDIYIFSADGGAWAQVPVTIPGTDPQCILPTFTPDGKDIVFYGYDIDSQTNKRIDSQIYSVPISGGAASAILVGHLS
jgi:Tol biopolymer transport system component